VLASSCFLNDGKGNFTRIDLPQELQLAPIFSFAPSAYKVAGSYVAVGNFYGVIPYEGRYDALQPTFFSFNKTTKSFQCDGKLASFAGEGRDAKWINYKGGTKALIIARNNQPLVFLKPVQN
jgi:hypothetical protein